MGEEKSSPVSLPTSSPLYLPLRDASQRCDADTSHDRPISRALSHRAGLSYCHDQAHGRDKRPFLQLLSVCSLKAISNLTFSVNKHFRLSPVSFDAQEREKERTGELSSERMRGEFCRRDGESSVEPVLHSPCSALSCFSRQALLPPNKRTEYESDS